MIAIRKYTVAVLWILGFSIITLLLAATFYWWYAMLLPALLQPMADEGAYPVFWWPLFALGWIFAPVAMVSQWAKFIKLVKVNIELILLTN